jgi:hypothetical protein
MVTYGGMSKKPITVSTSSFIFKVSHAFLSSLFSSFPLLIINCWSKGSAIKKLHVCYLS